MSRERQAKIDRLKAHMRKHPEDLARVVLPVIAAAMAPEAAPLEWIDPAAKRVWVVDFANGAPSKTINGDAGDVARSLFAVWPQGEFFPVPDQAEQISFRVDGVELALIRVLG